VFFVCFLCVFCVFFVCFLCVFCVFFVCFLCVFCVFFVFFSMFSFYLFINYFKIISKNTQKHTNYTPFYAFSRQIFPNVKGCVICVFLCVFSMFSFYLFTNYFKIKIKNNQMRTKLIHTLLRIFPTICQNVKGV
jgi:hypothetical protein